MNWVILFSRISQQSNHTNHINVALLVYVSKISHYKHWLIRMHSVIHFTHYYRYSTANLFGLFATNYFCNNPHPYKSTDHRSTISSKNRENTVLENWNSFSSRSTTSCLACVNLASHVYDQAQVVWLFYSAIRLYFMLFIKYSSSYQYSLRLLWGWWLSPQCTCLLLKENAKN